MTDELLEGPGSAGRAAHRVDRSALSLLLSNLFTLAVALVGNWSLADLLWIYWGQSVVIGFFNWRRIRLLQNFSTENFTMNKRPVDPTPETRRRVASFFALHYGVFHVAYLGFLVSDAEPLSPLDMLATVVCVGLFAANHRYSFRYNLERDLAGKPNIGTIMFFPYARIVPMHVTIIAAARFAPESKLAMVLFIALKTLADWIMHAIEHHQRRASVART